MTRRFPRGPKLDDASPFRDADGRNPFGEEGGSQAIGPADAYAAPQASLTSLPDPRNYDPILVARSGLVLALGVAGLILSAVAATGTVAGFLAGSRPFDGMVFGIPASLLALALSIPGWIIGRSDRRAMRAGAMQNTQPRRAWIGYACSIAGTLVSAAVAASLPALVVSAFL